MENKEKELTEKVSPFDSKKHELKVIHNI